MALDEGQEKTISSNKYKATLTLGAASLGLLASYPYQQYFWGGLMASGCQAAVVGGLADWFAVTALFRRPLGIPFRTAIIPRNREKIFQAITEMVEKELLSKENIKQALDNYDIPEVLIHYLDEHNGKKYLKEIMYQFTLLFIRQVNPAELGDIISEMVKKNVAEAKLAPLVIDAAEWLINNHFDDRILNFTIDQFVKVAEHDHMKHLLADLFIEATRSYERGLERRRVFNQILQLSPKQVAEDTQKALLEFLGSLKTGDHPLRFKLKDQLTGMLADFKADQELQQQIETWKMEQLTHKANLNKYITEFIAAWCANLIQEGENAGWLEQLAEQVDKFIHEFAHNEAKRAKFDSVAKNLLGEWVDAHHSEIGKLVRESLHRLTDDMLVEFIESRVGNDLQMIRINGSVVGGLVGMLIYLLTFWW